MNKRGGVPEFLLHTFGGDIFTTADAVQAGVSARRLRLAVDTGGLRSLGRGRWVIEDDDRSLFKYRNEASALLDGRAGVVLAGVTGAAW